MCDWAEGKLEEGRGPWAPEEGPLAWLRGGEQGTGTGEVMGEKHWAAVC